MKNWKRATAAILPIVALLGIGVVWQQRRQAPAVPNENELFRAANDMFASASDIEKLAASESADVPELLFRVIQNTELFPAARAAAVRELAKKEGVQPRLCAYVASDDAAYTAAVVNELLAPNHASVPPFCIQKLMHYELGTLGESVVRGSALPPEHLAIREDIGKIFQKAGEPALDLLRDHFRLGTARPELVALKVIGDIRFTGACELVAASQRAAEVAGDLGTSSIARGLWRSLCAPQHQSRGLARDPNGVGAK